MVDIEVAPEVATRAHCKSTSFEPPVNAETFDRFVPDLRHMARN
jgi:hypothetical protein